MQTLRCPAVGQGCVFYRSSDSVERQKVSTHNMGGGAPASTNNFQHGVRGWRLAFDLNGQDAKQQDLDSCTCCIPASRARCCVMLLCPEQAIGGNSNAETLGRII